MALITGFKATFVFPEESCSLARGSNCNAKGLALGRVNCRSSDSFFQLFEVQMSRVLGPKRFKTHVLQRGLRVGQALECSIKCSGLVHFLKLFGNPGT